MKIYFLIRIFFLAILLLRRSLLIFICSKLLFMFSLPFFFLDALLNFPPVTPIAPIPLKLSNGPIKFL